MKKVLLMIAIAMISCGNVETKSEKVLTEGEQNAMDYVMGTISNSVQVDSVTISHIDTLLCADMPEIDDSLYDQMAKKFGTQKITEKEFRDFLGKRSDALMAISKTWKFSRIKTDNAKYLIDEIRLDKRWGPYWRTVYTVNVFIKGLCHEYRVMMDSTCIKAITTEEDFRNMMNKKEDGIFDIFD